MAMTKEQFKARAQNLAEIAKQKGAHAKDLSKVEENRASHLADISKFDPAAAEAERKFFDADNVRAAAELALGEYYAGKIEQK